MTRKLFVLIVLIAVCASLVACKAKNPVAPTPIPIPTLCEDPKATNLGGPLPCKFPPPDVIDVGGAVFVGMRPGGVAGVIFPVKDYAGIVEVQVRLDQEGTHSIRLFLFNETNNIVITSVVALITGSGVISLLHDGAACIAYVRNEGTSVLSGRTTFVYKRN